VSDNDEPVQHHGGFATPEEWDRLKARIAELEKERDELKGRCIELKGRCIGHLNRRNGFAAKLSEYNRATNGHTLENIKTIMQAAPSPEELEGFTLLKVTTTYRAEPITEYIPTDEITDELVDELGRISCEVRDTSKEQWQQGLLMEVILREEGLIYAVRTTGETMPFEYCRIKKSDLTSAEKRTNENNTTEGSPNE
jgi:hypothetical protein